MKVYPITDDTIVAHGFESKEDLQKYLDSLPHRFLDKDKVLELIPERHRENVRLPEIKIEEETPGDLGLIFPKGGGLPSTPLTRNMIFVQVINHGRVYDFPTLCYNFPVMLGESMTEELLAEIITKELDRSRK